MISPRIRPLDTVAIAQARERQSQLTKPPGSLGRLEELSIQLAGILGYPLPDLRSKALIVMAADHGVAREGVSAYPAEVTPQMVLNFLGGGAAINVLARHAGAEVIVVDMGVAHEFGDQPGLLDRKIAPGTANLMEGPAMTREQAQASIEAGRQIAFDVAGRGIHLIGTGDMGIGNTTPSSAIGSALLRAPVPELVGRGTGIDDKGLQRKIAAIERALEVNIPDPSDPVDVLTKVGGFEIGGVDGCDPRSGRERPPSGHRWIYQRRSGTAGRQIGSGISGLHDRGPSVGRIRPPTHTSRVGAGAAVSVRDAAWRRYRRCAGNARRRSRGVNPRRDGYFLRSERQ